MKKHFLLLFLLLISTFVFAKTAPVPSWVSDYRSIFPDSEYIAQRGSGDSAEKAITDASASLARYFQMTVNANISTTMTADKTTVVDEVHVKSDVKLFGMQFTEPYRYKKDKKWYAVAYLKRSDAWVQYKPIVDQSSKTFAEKYKKIEEEQDNFSKIALCYSASEAGKELLARLEYARIISPKNEASYQKDRDNIAKIPVLIDEAKGNCIIYFDCPNDYNNILTTVISSAFSKAGMTVSKNQSQANYICSIDIDNNATGSDPLTIIPVVSVRIAGKDGRAVYAYDCTARDKTISYTMENAKKKGYPKLAKDLEKGLVDDFYIFLMK